MNDPGLVGSSQTLRKLNGNVYEPLGLKGSHFKHRAERLALDVLHCDPREPVGNPCFVDGDNIVVVQGRGRPCFGLETFQSFWIGSQLPGEDLYSYLPSKARIFSTVHLAHSASAQRADDLETA